MKSTFARAEIKLRQYGCTIIELFEDILDEHQIVIPDEDRTGEDGESAIYGMTFGALLGDIADILDELVKEVRENGDAKIDKWNL